MRTNGWRMAWAAVVVALLLVGCKDGDQGGTGPNGPDGPPDPIDTVLDRFTPLPGLAFAIQSVDGATGTGGQFQVGDTLSVTFTVELDDGTPLPIEEVDYGGIYFSGPSSNYQIVIPRQTDLITASVENADGSYTYTFADPIPAVYAPPLNDSSSFGALDGEMTAAALQDGTYTVGIEAYKNFTVVTETVRDAANATEDVLFGAATTLDPRELVAQANCDRCHGELEAHGTIRRDVRLCVLCHTSGAEDRNVASVEGGTPGVSIDLRVMIHRIHNGAHLPSVLGVATNPGGARNYSATPEPYRIVGYGNSVHDFSAASFPVMPSGYVAYLYDTAGTTYTGTGGNGPTPRDVGYSSLTAAQKEKDDWIRTGLVSCDSCHGDPDEGGPIGAPADGDEIYSDLTRRSCGSCHDDIDWSYDYVSNNPPGMPAQPNDSSCTNCHTAQAIEDSHVHPYSSAIYNTGVNLDLTTVGGGTGAGGNHIAGDPFTVTFGVTDDTGADIQIHQLTRLQIIVVGPTANTQIILPNINAFDFAFRKSSPFTGSGSITTPTVGAAAVQQTIAVVFTSATTFDVVGSVSAPLVGQAIGAASGSTAAVTYADVSFTITQGSTQFANGDRWYFEVWPTATSYTLNVPLDISFERVGAATAGADVWTVGNLPLYWGRQSVFERTAIVAGAGIAADSAFLARYVVADSALVPGIAVGDRVVLDNGLGTEEYAQVGRIQTTDDVTLQSLGAADRIWFTTSLRYAHTAGALIQEVTLTSRREGVNYTMVQATGQITEVAGFTDGNPVVVSYRTDGRFGWRRAPGDALQAVYPAPIADSEEIDLSWGDWKGLALLNGTYTVGMWANRDFTLTPLGVVTTTEAWNQASTSNTTYRMISPPATLPFLFGTATEIETREIAAAENCNNCHDDLVFHGFGRRGLETCLLCHSAPGAEDGPKYSYATWYTDPTPGVTMDFRTLIHTAHMGEELTNGDTWEAIGVFLGVPYPFQAGEIVFPYAPGGVASCEACHGEGTTAWHEPEDRNHPSAATPTRTWRAVCTACHDDSSTEGHVNLNTSLAGQESCGVCHGPGEEYEVENMHWQR